MPTAAAQDVLNGVTNKTNSEVILFFVIIAVVFIICLPTIYGLVKWRTRKDFDKKLAEIKASSDQFQGWTDYTGKILNVISNNSVAMTELSTVLKTNNNNCEACKAEATGHWKDVLKNQQEILKEIESILNIVRGFERREVKI